MIHGDSLTGDAMIGWRSAHSQPENGIIHDVDPNQIAFGANTVIDDTHSIEHCGPSEDDSADTSATSAADTDRSHQIDLTNFYS